MTSTNKRRPVSSKSRRTIIRRPKTRTSDRTRARDEGEAQGPVGEAFSDSTFWTDNTGWVDA